MLESSVMVVEDEGIVAKDIQRRLERFGYSVQPPVSSAGEAIRLAEYSRPDIVLMDVVLKGNADGIDAAEQIRDRFDIPVIFLTAYADENTLRRARHSGPYGYILKPFNEIELRTTIEVALFKHQAERKLRQSEERYRFLVENAPDAIFSLSHQAIILDLNHAFETLTGWKRSEWIGKSFTDLVHADDISVAQHLFRLSSQGEKSATRELRIRKQSREYMNWEFTTTRFENGKSIALLGIARDITERKRFEEQIRQSQKMDSVGVLAGGVAHDFNNLLSVIIGHASMLERYGSDPGRRAEGLARIQQASERGAALVRQLMTVARKMEFALQPTNVNDIVKEIVVLVGETFPQTVDTSARLDPDLPAIIADANQIHQVLLNLCVNARDAMPHGGTISISTTLVSREELASRFPDSVASSYIVLSVGDSGEGMDEATRSHIFEPFFTTKGPGKGMGLGLAVVYGIIKNHSGFINVESTMGKGSVFSLYFPVPPPETALNTSRGEPAPGISEGTETILLVEDEEALMDLVEDALSSRGYHVLKAHDGEEAIKVFSHSYSDIGLVFSDIGLPKLGGEELLSRMQAIDPEVRVIFSSGYMDPELKTRLLKKGARDFIQKPHDPKLVSAKIREVLDHEKS